MAAQILRPRLRVAHNDSGRQPRVGRRLLPPPHARTPSSGSSRSTRLRSPSSRRRLQPRALLLGNLFRDQLDRYGELELVAARWRDAVAALPERDARRERRTTRRSPTSRAIGRQRSCSGSTTPPTRGPHSSTRPTRSTACGAATPYDYAAAYVGHLGDYRCPNCGHARPELDVAAREIELHGLDGSAFTLAAADGSSARRACASPASTTSTTRSAPPRSRSRSARRSTTIAAGLARFTAAFGRFERIEVDGKRLLILLVKNPAGANEVVRTLVDAGAPRVAVVALNDDIADGRDVSWIWDVDFEPLVAGLETLVATGSRAEELALRFAYGGLSRDRIEVVRSLAGALDRGLELTPPGGELAVLPTYTAMLRAAPHRRRHAGTSRTTGSGRHEAGSRSASATSTPTT